MDIIIPAHPERITKSAEDLVAQRVRIQQLLAERDAVLIAHYYTDPEVQALADATGGFIGDSLRMARFGMETPHKTLLVAGVHFMAESAKILSPEKTVLVPEKEATCSLDLSCPIDKFSQFCDAHADRTVVVYANTSAAVKARADWVVTSSNAVEIVTHLDNEGQKILWAPDRFLGKYIQDHTGADMLLWDGSCIVHEEFKAQGILDLKQQYPNAAVLVHPESPKNVVELADAVGSTSQLIEAAKSLPHSTLIVATDRGIFYKMQQAVPDKTLIEAPTAGHGATCKSCAHCPWMAMNSLDNIESTLANMANEVLVDANTIEEAKVSLGRMMDFSAKHIK